MYPYPQLTPPPNSKIEEESGEPKVNELIKTIVNTDKEINWNEIDITILGAPLSKSSISASAASETPKEMRSAWNSFNSYNIDYDVNLDTLNIIDLGDIKQHVTDIAICHKNIMQSMVSMRTVHPNTIPIVMGGDHSITAMLVKGWKKVHNEERIGILQFDTHFDLRDLKDNGPSNGTPIRNLIESRVIKGRDVWNIGVHGFFNAKSLKTYADQNELNYVTIRELRKKGIEKVVINALEDLSSRVDTIYMTVDMDVLDTAFGPGVPSSTPGGMYTDELIHAVFLAGCYKKVKSMDIVCIDPTKDISKITIKTGVHAMLNFISGKVSKKEREYVR